MRFTSHEIHDGLDERRFTHDGVDGILWSPPDSDHPTPLVLAGPPGGPAGLMAPCGAA